MSRFAAGLVLLLLFPLGAAAEGPQQKTDTLFLIERSKNGNYVCYDAVLNDHDDLAGPNPVTVHWVLENGRTEALNLIQNRYAYGVLSQERLGKNRFRIVLAAFKERMIIVEKVGGEYKALVPINGIQSILDKIYVKAEDSWLGFPKVAFIDVFGRALNNHAPLRERILPH